jgi:hypothetical protein
MNFSSLNFIDHSIKGTTRAEYTFRNYWTISVVAGPTGSGLYGDIQHDTFEVAVFRPNGNMLEDVIRWQTPVQITTMMRLIAML